MYEEGLKYDKTNAQLVESLNKVNERLTADASAGAFGGMRNPFADPKFLANLAMNPKTRNLLNDPEVAKLLADMQRNPNEIRCEIEFEV